MNKQIRIKRIFEIHSAKNKQTQQYQDIVIIKWNDRTETRATCDVNDKFDLEQGINICTRKKFLPEKQLQFVMKKRVTVVQG